MIFKRKKDYYLLQDDQIVAHRSKLFIQGQMQYDVMQENKRLIEQRSQNRPKASSYHSLRQLPQEIQESDVSLKKQYKNSIDLQYQKPVTKLDSTDLKPSHSQRTLSSIDQKPLKNTFLLKEISNLKQEIDEMKIKEKNKEINDLKAQIQEMKIIQKHKDNQQLPQINHYLPENDNTRLLDQNQQQFLQKINSFSNNQRLNEENRFQNLQNQIRQQLEQQQRLQQEQTRHYYCEINQQFKNQINNLVQKNKKIQSELSELKKYNYHTPIVDLDSQIQVPELVSKSEFMNVQKVQNIYQKNENRLNRLKYW